ncbi:MAG: isoprenyl synthetase [Flavobacteriales bacterium]|nr:isoprenyl synthetase [Flavobacteriales bacterium]|tara:strand:- start:2910 stop:3875 length:966 start_codon:yes stop_codon:yes gene_type:complete
MKSIQELQLLIQEELKTIYFPANPKNLYDPIKYVMGIGGKRIRPVLTLMAHQIFNSDIEKSVKAAVAIEIFHNFTLLHDDIMDEAPLRRGVKTVHEKWDKNSAILSGDTMLVQSYNLLMSVEDIYLREVLNTFNKAAIEVCEGQQWDMDYENREVVSIKEYLKMIEYKTSVLLAASLKIGAINGGATKEESNHLYEFGKNMGIAFQLKDDLLDTFGDPGNFGKQLGGDIISNKKTYLYLKALELSDEYQKERLIYYFSNTIERDQKIEAVKKIFSNLEIPAQTTKLMEQYHKRALSHLDSINSDAKKPLYTFSELLLKRIS